VSSPPGVVQYWTRIIAVIVYLYVGQFLSKKCTAVAVVELFGTLVCEGTVVTMTVRGS
jgi:transposase